MRGIGVRRLRRLAPCARALQPGAAAETFDVVFVDECHHSIYSLWRRVLEYFDTFSSASRPRRRS
jgi:type I restriction enzyme R subunit